MFQIQRIVIECDDRQIQIGKEGNEAIFVQTHEKLYPLFRKGNRTKWLRTKETLDFSRIFSDGMIQESRDFSQYLQFVLQAAGIGISPIGRTEVMIIIPSTQLPANKTVWAQVCDDIGLGDVTFCSTAIAGAVGAGFSFPLLTFVPVLHLGWSSSEFTGVSFDSCVFTQDVSCSGKEIQSILAAQSFHDLGIECSDIFWHGVFHRLGDLLTSESAISMNIYSQVSSSEKKSIPFEWLHEHLVTLVETMIRRVQMKMSEFTPSQLALSTGQGIVLIGDLGTQVPLSTYFSGKLSVPVYSLPDLSFETIKGGMSVFSALTTGE